MKEGKDEKTDHFLCSSTGNATESQVYDTSTLTLGTKLSQGDTLHYDKQNVGSVANIVNAKGDYDLAFISEEDYVLPFDAEVVGITALTIYLAPAVDGIAYTDVRTLSDGDTIDRNTNLLCYDYVINNRVLPVFPHPIMTSTSGQAPFG